MNFHPISPENLQDEASEAINYIARYYENVHDYPVRSQVEFVYLRDLIPENAPTLPESLRQILEDVDNKIMPGSTCEAVVCTLAAARDRVLEVHGEEKITKLVVYASDQTHFTFQKAAKLVGISLKNFRVLPTSSTADFALSPDTLKAAIEVDVSQGLVPLYVCATIGTTASGAVDPLDGLGKIARAFCAWLHVDAAFAGIL
uniref:Uncharacterized protein n=1 Tax=Chenopodium quinoa TaxID=63459 RepID=A0A803M8D1_CHEQI